jgi:hypothetical protein
MSEKLRLREPSPKLNCDRALGSDSTICKFIEPKDMGTHGRWETMKKLWEIRPESFNLHTSIRQNQDSRSVANLDEPQLVATKWIWTRS